MNRANPPRNSERGRGTPPLPQRYKLLRLRPVLHRTHFDETLRGRVGVVVPERVGDALPATYLLPTPKTWEFYRDPGALRVNSTLCGHLAAVFRGEAGLSHTCWL